MMDFKEELVKLLEKETKLDNKEVAKLLEVPPSEDLGDYAFPCFTLAKQLKKSPVQIAAEITESVKKGKEHKFLSKAEAKGPYVNFFVNGALLSEQVLKAIAKEKAKYGKHKSRKKTIMVEFFHANTHKGVHIGHLRNISIGESICRLLEAAGFKVLR